MASISASGSATSELRVAALNATALAPTRADA